MNMPEISRTIRTAAAAAILLAAACAPSRTDDDATPAETAVAAPPQIAATAVLPPMIVYKSPTCGCCKGWVEHVKAAGFAVEVHDLDDVTGIKDEAGVPAAARSCHTAIVGGYTIEGHVPAETVVRLLKERPEAAGLAVPGMPVGTPGMEVPGQPADKYDVLVYRADGSTSVYEAH